MQSAVTTVRAFLFYVAIREVRDSCKASSVEAVVARAMAEHCVWRRHKGGAAGEGLPIVWSSIDPIEMPGN